MGVEHKVHNRSDVTHEHEAEACKEAARRMNFFDVLKVKMFRPFFS